VDVLHAYVREHSGRLRLAQLETYQARYVDGLSVPAVARTRGEAYKSARMRLYRLRRAARRWLARRSAP
jgi:hypothetical protein